MEPSTTIRPWGNGDEIAVDALLATLWGHDPARLSDFAVHGAPADAPGAFRQTYVAENQEDVVGVGSVWDYWLHPTCWRVALHVRPEHQRRGFGSALFERLVADVADRPPRPFQTATVADDIDGRRFLLQRGFRLLMRTRLGVWNPRAIEATVWRDIGRATERVTAAGYRIVAWPDLRSEVTSMTALAVLHAEVYRLAHAWSPPAAITEESARQLFLDPDDLIPNALFVAVRNDLPVAVASLRHAESPAEFELGWVGVSARHQAHGDDLTLALAGQCCRHAEKHHREIRFEVDQADRRLWSFMGTLPRIATVDWLTFVRSATC